MPDWPNCKPKWKHPKLKKIRKIKCWKTKYGWKVWHDKKNFKMRHGVDIGTGTDLFCHEPIYIGDNVQIGGHCLLYTYNSINQTRACIIIGDNVTIGAKSIILPGVVIRADEHVPAGSIVYFRKGETIIK